METNFVLSLGSLIGLLGLFYAWHKEQKSTSNQISVLENKVQNLSEKMKSQDIAITTIQQTLQRIDVKLARIDTQLSQLLEDKR
jgi:peptidoglycan hydrolase CwlO-like protein